MERKDYYMNGNLPCLQWNFTFLGWDGVVTELWEFMGWDGLCCDGIAMLMWLRFVMLLLWLWEGSLLLLEKERVEMEIRLQEVRDHKVVKWWLALCVVAWFVRAELASWLGEVNMGDNDIVQFGDNQFFDRFSELWQDCDMDGCVTTWMIYVSWERGLAC